MLNIIPTPHYPAPLRTNGSAPQQEPIITVARIIIAAVPVHRRSDSTASSTSASNSEEKAPLLNSASKAVRSSYGSLLNRKQEHRKAELKKSISRPVSHEPEWLKEFEAGKDEVMERSLGSTYSTQTWASEAEAELERVGAFKYDTGREAARGSIASFESSERSYTFF